MMMAVLLCSPAARLCIVTPAAAHPPCPRPFPALAAPTYSSAAVKLKLRLTFNVPGAADPIVESPELSAFPPTL